MKNRGTGKWAKQRIKRQRSLRLIGLYLLLALATIAACLFTTPLLAQTPHPNLPTLSNRHVDPASLVQQSRQLYDAEQYREAIPLLQQAAQTYATQGNLLRQALALSNLSLTHQQLAQWEEARAAIDQSLAIVRIQASRGDHESKNTAQLQVLAQALDIQGQLQFNQGQMAEALATWEQATATYERIDDQPGSIENQLRQSEALQELGLYRRAANVLNELTQLLNRQPPSATYASALRNLGDVLLVTEDLSQSRKVLEQSLEIARQLSIEVADEAIAASYISLGNLTHTEAIANLTLAGLTPTKAIASLNAPVSASNNTTKEVIQQRNQIAAKAFYQQTNLALDLYQKAAVQTQVTSTQVQAHLNQFVLLVEIQQWKVAYARFFELNRQLQQQLANHKTLYNQIEFAQSLISIASHTDIDLTSQASLLQTIQQIITTTHQQAAELGDRRIQSYALGTLGNFYEKTEKLAEAQISTQQALGISQAIKANDISYRWQWQLGRILKSQHNIQDAIAAYETSLATLQSLRRDLVTTNLSYQLAFRADAEEPIYQGLIDLLLLDSKPTQENLKRSRAVATSLQVAKLENFLGEPCADSDLELIDDTVDRLAVTTAIIYPIALGDRLEVIVKLPREQDLYHFRTEVSSTELQDVIQSLQLDLEQEYTFEAIKINSKRLYDWMIKRVQTQLIAKQVDTLIFALDGSLRNIPMAALYDGEKYLVETYATAITLGLDLPNPTPLEREDLKVLAVGLTEPPKDFIVNSQNLSANFAKLANVNNELDAIAASGIPTATLRDQEFTENSFNRKINEESFPIVHMATHGQFSSDPNSTFLLTSDGAIAVDAFSNLFEARGESRSDSIELLILNACETAAGDQLAALGIAGAAFRAGARSVIASLWTLDDTSSVELTRQFYKSFIQSKITKAEALRRAQISLLANPQYKHPRYWATYVFVGNWL